MSISSSLSRTLDKAPARRILRFVKSHERSGGGGPLQGREGHRPERHALNVPAKATHAADAPVQPSPRPAHPIRLRPGQPRRGRPPHRPDAHDGVGDVVGNLIADGMAEEVGRGPSSGGKAPILVSVIDDARHVIGLDLGDSTFVGAIVNLRGEVRRSVELPVEGRDGDDALAARVSTGRRAQGRRRRERCSASVSGRRASSTREPGRSAGRSTSTGRTCRSASSCTTATASPSTWPTTARPRHSPNTRSAATPRAGRTSWRSRSGGASAPASSSTATLFQGDGFGAGEIGHIVVEDDGAPVPLRPVRLPRDGGERAGDRGSRSPARELDAAETLDDVRDRPRGR